MHKYIEIENYLIEKIESEEFKKNDPLISESEICKIFNCSHMTVNRAMNDLNIKGYITRIPGKGTFISDGYKKGFTQQGNHLKSVSVLIKEMGKEVKTKIITYMIIRGEDVPDVAQKLHIKKDDYLHYFVRARYGDNNLVCLSYTYIVQSVLPTIDIRSLDESFNEYVSSCGIKRSAGFSEYCATLPTNEQLEYIKNPNTPLLKQSLIWIANGQYFELTYHYFVGDKYTVSQNLIIES